jgi:hypothetical protein
VRALQAARRATPETAEAVKEAESKAESTIFMNAEQDVNLGRKD